MARREGPGDKANVDTADLREIKKAVENFCQGISNILVLYENYEKTSKRVLDRTSQAHLLQDYSYLKSDVESVRKELLVLLPSVVTFLDDCIVLADHIQYLGIGSRTSEKSEATWSEWAETQLRRLLGPTLSNKLMGPSRRQIHENNVRTKYETLSKNMKRFCDEKLTPLFAKCDSKLKEAITELESRSWQWKHYGLIALLAAAGIVLALWFAPASSSSQALAGGLGVAMVGCILASCYSLCCQRSAQKIVNSFKDIENQVDKMRNFLQTVMVHCSHYYENCPKQAIKEPLHRENADELKQLMDELRTNAKKLKLKLEKHIKEEEQREVKL